MTVDDCSVVTVLNGANYCLVIVHQTSWMDELNALPPSQVAALLSSVALIWYVASAIRTQLSLLAHTEEK